MQNQKSIVPQKNMWEASTVTFGTTFFFCFIFVSMQKHIFWYFIDTSQSSHNLHVTGKTINQKLAVSINPENWRIFLNCIKPTMSKEFYLGSCNLFTDLLAEKVMCAVYPVHFVYPWVSSALAARKGSSRNCWLSWAASEGFCLDALQVETAAEMPRLFTHRADLVYGVTTALTFCFPPHHLPECINALI